MITHKALMKRYKWYRNWHKNPYSGFVHLTICLAAFLYDFFLVLKLLIVLQLI